MPKRAMIFARACDGHKQTRTVHLGENVTLIFEDEITMRYQVQEMLRVEKIFEESAYRMNLTLTIR
jgi:hypothetical protein